MSKWVEVTLTPYNIHEYIGCHTKRDNWRDDGAIRIESGGCNLKKFFYAYDYVYGATDGWSYTNGGDTWFIRVSDLAAKQIKEWLDET